MIELLYREGCPYSRKVLDYIEQNNLGDQVEYRCIDADSESMERLQSLTGAAQVPCLAIDDKPMLESDDIIKWLDDHLVHKH